MKKSKIVLFEIRGAQFLCLPWMYICNKLHYKLCFAKKITDNIHNLSIEYEAIGTAETRKEAKEKARQFLKYFST